MNKLGRVLLLTASLGVTTAVVEHFNPGKTRAAGFDQVQVVNSASSPVPVTGKVNAAQSGPWTVGINGTPTVNVASAPPVNVNFPSNIGINGTVPVQNAPGLIGFTPFVVQDFENPARSAFQASCTAALVNVFYTCDLASIPGTKTLVIETVSASISIDSPNFPGRVVIVTKAGGIFANHYFSPVLLGSTTNGINYYAATATAKLYADPGTVVSGTVITNSNSASAYFTISGHFVCTNYQEIC